MKHTKGPWEIEGGINNSYILSDTEHGITIGVIGEIEHSNSWEIAKEYSSNAKLIAAAPDLLEALEELQNTDWTISKDWINNAKQAIVKAIRGEE